MKQKKRFIFSEDYMLFLWDNLKNVSEFEYKEYITNVVVYGLTGDNSLYISKRLAPILRAVKKDIDKRKNKSSYDCGRYYRCKNKLKM